MEDIHDKFEKNIRIRNEHGMLQKLEMHEIFNCEKISILSKKSI